MAQCWSLTVPADHGQPNGKNIRLAVAEIPAISPTATAVPLLYITGGPGSDGIQDSELLVEAGLNRTRPLIVFSQRGTYSSSTPLVCPSIDRFRGNSLDRPYDAPSTGEGLVKAATDCRKELVASGVNLVDYTTSQSATDLETLRTAMNIKEWDVIGHSYGTDLALTYMREYPQGIRSVVLDGIVPPSTATPGWTWSSLKESFENILSACAAQPTCKARYPDTGSTFSHLVNQLSTHPITTTVTVPGRTEPVKVTLDGGALVNWLTRQSHFPTTVPMEIDEMAHGNPGPIAQQWAEARILPQSHVGVFAHGLSYSVWCSEWVPYETAAQQLQDGEKAFPTFPRSVVMQAPQLAFLRQICKAWNVPKTPQSIRSVTRSTIPTLALSGSFDAQTGAQWGPYVAKTLTNGIVVTLPGVSHGAFGNACGASVINSFLVNPKAPDTSCVANMKLPTFVVK
jgi:pimeloyl-ACP methyl ester carboxylesterase